MYHKDLLPVDYPWLAERNSVLITKDRDYPMSLEDGKMLEEAEIDFDGAKFPLDAYLDAVNRTVIFDRIPVVAIGSNASPLVTRCKIEKYAAKGTDLTIPMFPAVIENMNVGFSGHFVMSGYIPAAPFHDEGNRLDVTVAFLTPAQLAAIDSTEPTYRRLEVSREDYPVTLPNGEVLQSAYVYATRYGVLRDSLGAPITLSSQHELYNTLHEHGIGKGFFRGEGKAVSDRIAGKGTWAKNRVRWTEVFEGVTLDDKITGTEDRAASEWWNTMFPAERENTSPSDEELAWEEEQLMLDELGYDPEELDDEEYDQLMDHLAQSGALNEQWLDDEFHANDYDERFEEEYDAWWNHSLGPIAAERWKASRNLT